MTRRRGQPRFFRDVLDSRSHLGTTFPNRARHQRTPAIDSRGEAELPHTKHRDGHYHTRTGRASKKFYCFTNYILCCSQPTVKTVACMVYSNFILFYFLSLIVSGI